MTTRRTHFYVDKVNGKFLGVCAGVADYTGWSPFGVRVAFIVLSLLIMGHILVPLYFVVAWLAPKKPHDLYAMDPQETEFWQGVRRSPRTSARDVRTKFRDLDRRMGDVEAYYTSHNSRLSKEIDNLK
jgi:phage shock protein C